MTEAACAPPGRTRNARRFEASTALVKVSTSRLFVVFARLYFKPVALGSASGAPLCRCIGACTGVTCIRCIRVESCPLPAPKRAFSAHRLTDAGLHFTSAHDRTEFSPLRRQPCQTTSSASPTSRTMPAAGPERLQSQPPVVLTQNGRGRAVVLSYDAFRAMQAEVALLTRLSRAEDDLKAGRAKPQEKVLTQARAARQAAGETTGGSWRGVRFSGRKMRSANSTRSLTTSQTTVPSTPCTSSIV
jgi:PHD/YefM family antitoxin component YafN of YafNO toxin-antitoxin module